MDYYTQVLKKYAAFDGRSTRKEYWMFILFNMIICFLGLVVITFISSLANTDLRFLIVLYQLAIFLPALGLTIRRLHDTSRSGWWLLITLVPIIGGIVLFVFMCLDSTPGDNQFGPNPKEISQSV